MGENVGVAACHIQKIKQYERQVNAHKGEPGVKRFQGSIPAGKMKNDRCAPAPSNTENPNPEKSSIGSITQSYYCIFSLPKQKE
jgi:hypothetical protein